MGSLLQLVADVPFIADAKVDEAGLVGCGLPYPEGVRATVTAVRQDDDYRQIEIAGELGDGGGKLRLSPERGVSGAAAALNEIELHEPAIDDAYVIRGDDAALLLALRTELLRLADAPPTLVVDGAALTMTWPKLTGAQLPAVLEAALALWHRAVFHRLGIG